MKIEDLEYFVGKICSVFTVPTNRDFKAENPSTFPQPIFHYFVGKVLEVTNRGVSIEQWNSEKRLRTFFFLDHIVSISEEEILDPSNPKDVSIIEEYKKVNEIAKNKAEENIKQLKQTQKYVDIADLQDISGKSH